MTAETMQTDRGEAPVYRAGTLAYLDSFAGLLPVTVLEVTGTDLGYVAAPVSDSIRIRLNVTCGGYRRGEIITASAHDVVPRNHVRRSGGHYRINSLYVWR